MKQFHGDTNYDQANEAGRYNTTVITAPGRNAHRAVLLRLVGAALLAMTLILFTNATAQNGVQMSNPATGITVTGSGAAYGEPDRAVVTLGVNTAQENVRDALAAADNSMNAVRQAVIDLGVPANQIRTAWFNVWRQQLTDRDGQPTGNLYHVTHTFQISVDNADIIGQVLAAAVDAGANEVGNISFTFADTAALQTRARQAAMADAHARASQLAELAGVTLGQATYIEETSYNAPMAVRSAMAMEAPMYDGFGGASIESGELAVHVTVRVVYAIASGE